MVCLLKLFRNIFIFIFVIHVSLISSLATNIYIGKHFENINILINISSLNRIYEISNIQKRYDIYEYFTENEIIILSKLLWGEDRGSSTTDRKAAVIWCVLNRLDDGRWGNNIFDVATSPYQFVGYNKDNPIDDSSMDIVEDVLLRYIKEKNGEKNIGRVLPINYYWFTSKNNENVFYSEYKDDSSIWEWNFVSPYNT